MKPSCELCKLRVTTTLLVKYEVLQVSALASPRAFLTLGDQHVEPHWSQGNPICGQFISAAVSTSF